MSKAVTSVSALVGPTEPCGVASGSTFSGGGSGAGAVCWTPEGGVEADDIDGLAGGATGGAVCALATDTRNRAVRAKEENAARAGIGIVPTAVRGQWVLE